MDKFNNGKFLGELESDVMEVIWRSAGPVSVREVYVVLQKKRQIAYTTVMTIMGRLTAKGLLKRKDEGKAYQYLASYSKDRFLTNISRQIIKNFVSNFGETAIAHFASELEKIPTQKKQELVKLLKKNDK